MRLACDRQGVIRGPGDNAPMTSVGPAPRFNGKAILVDYSPAVRNARIIHAAIHGLVEDAGAKEDELLLGTHQLVAEYDGLVARLTGNDDKLIVFAVTRQ
jgi:hypothetical protein